MFVVQAPQSMEVLLEQPGQTKTEAQGDFRVILKAVATPHRSGGPRQPAAGPCKMAGHPTEYCGVTACLTQPLSPPPPWPSLAGPATQASQDQLLFPS